MLEVRAFALGGYRYVRGPFQYSAGVAAEPGFELRRVCFKTPVPLAIGFAFIEQFLGARGRPLTAFCACELRSPAPFDDAGFIAFNRVYVGTLERWGIFSGEENPVARSNVCPELHKPGEPSFYAFTYTVPSETPAGTSQDFLIAGSGEAQEGAGSYEERTVRHGDTSAPAMLEKAQHVLGTMEARMAALGFTWADTSAVQVYTVYDLYPLMASEIASRGAAQHSLSWYYARPPVVGLDFEMDVRGVTQEISLATP